jgi:hypothetical protein
MLFVMMVLVLTALALPIVLVLMLRNLGRQEVETETVLMAPGAHTVRYVVPEGDDPAPVRAALDHAGFASVLDRGGDQRLVVRCEPGERDRIRQVIHDVHVADVHRTAAGRTRPRFDDEPS